MIQEICSKYTPPCQSADTRVLILKMVECLETQKIE